jgi:Flp pilus assembly protein TadD
VGRRQRAALAVLLSAALLHIGAGAASSPPSSDLPDLAAVRARIYSGDYASAVAELTALTQTVQHAEVYNLLGYSLRQLQRYDEAARWYREALAFDPTHRPALEYQGELFIATGDLAAARANLRTLQLLCGHAGCEEIDMLRRALQAHGPR